MKLPSIAASKSKGIGESLGLMKSGATPVVDVRPPQVSAFSLHCETFSVTYSRDGAKIRHSRWSLSGAGRDLVEARQAMLDEACDLADILRNDTESSCTKDAWSLRSFALQIEAERLARQTR